MIWCVEDDAGIRDIEVYTLKSTGFEAEGFCDGADFFNALAKEKPELVILDVMLPGEDGVEILKKLRQNPETRNIPVIMATAKGTEYDKIQSLDLGADDYLVKPFGMMEMVSRVRAVLRRCSAVSRQDASISASTVVLDPLRRSVTVSGEPVTLTYKEFELLQLFLSNPGRVFTREQLFEQVWEMSYCGETRTVDMHIRTLRQKLGEGGNIIGTVRGVGYRLEENA